MRAFRKLASSAFVLLCASCGTLQPPQEYDQLGRRVLLITQGQDSVALNQLLAPELLNSTAQAQLRQVSDSLRIWAPDSIALIGWNVVRGPGWEAAELSYELHGPERWGAAVLAFKRYPNGIRVQGFRIFPRMQSMASENAFVFRGRSMRHYLILAALCCSVLFSLGSAVQVLRTPMPRRWWLAALALVSFGTIQLNWTTGEWSVLSSYFSLFGGGVTKSGPVAPWVITVGLPLGACIALWRRSEFLRRSGSSPIGSS